MLVAMIFPYTYLIKLALTAMWAVASFFEAWNLNWKSTK